MVFIEICVGSSCHLKGAPIIIELLRKFIADEHLEDDIVLRGSFCTGKCNRIGITIIVNDTIYTGITVDGFKEFCQTIILPAVASTKENIK